MSAFRNGSDVSFLAPSLPPTVSHEVLGDVRRSQRRGALGGQGAGGPGLHRGGASSNRELHGTGAYTYTNRHLGTPKLLV